MHVVLADGGASDVAGVEADVGGAVVAAAVEGDAEALVEVAGQAGVPGVVGEPLQEGPGWKRR